WEGLCDHASSSCDSSLGAANDTARSLFPVAEPSEGGSAEAKPHGVKVFTRAVYGTRPSGRDQLFRLAQLEKVAVRIAKEAACFAAPVHGRCEEAGAAGAQGFVGRPAIGYPDGEGMAAEHDGGAVFAVELCGEDVDVEVASAGSVGRHQDVRQLHPFE